MQETKYTIYKVTNIVTGKVYVGQTKYKLSERFAWHKSRARNNKGHAPLLKAIREYGETNFSIEALEENVSQDNVDDCERYWIKKCNSLFPDGYNLQIGGKDTTRFGAKGYIDSRQGRCYGKKVIVCDKTTGREIAVFNGVYCAARFLNKGESVNSIATSISMCCGGKTKSACGYKWKYVEE